LEAYYRRLKEGDITPLLLIKGMGSPPTLIKLVGPCG